MASRLNKRGPTPSPKARNPLGLLFGGQPNAPTGYIYQKFLSMSEKSDKRR